MVVFINLAIIVADIFIVVIAVVGTITEFIVIVIQPRRQRKGLRALAGDRDIVERATGIGFEQTEPLQQQARGMFAIKLNRASACGRLYFQPGGGEIKINLDIGAVRRGRGALNIALHMPFTILQLLDGQPFDHPFVHAHTHTAHKDGIAEKRANMRGRVGQRERRLFRRSLRRLWHGRIGQNDDGQPTIVPATNEF